uniref:Uncharacterized protein n=1 Tax=Rhodnius prolixus TaxID=13249 RepID=T1HZN1_RHOPR
MLLSTEENEMQRKKLMEKESALILRENIIDKFNGMKGQITKILNLNEKEKLYDEQWIKRNLLDLFTNSQVWDDFEVEIQNEMDSLSTSIDKEYLSMVNEIKSWKNLFIDPYNISNKIRAILNSHIHISTYAFKENHFKLEIIRRRCIYKMWIIRKINCLYSQEIPWFSTVLNVPNEQLTDITTSDKSPNVMIAEVLSGDVKVKQDLVGTIHGQEVAVVETRSSPSDKVTPNLLVTGEVEEHKTVIDYTRSDIEQANSVDNAEDKAEVKLGSLTSRQRRIMHNCTATREYNARLELIEKHLYLKGTLSDNDYSVLIYLRAKKMWIERFVVDPFIEERPPARPDVAIDTIYLQLQSQQTDVPKKICRQISRGGFAVRDLKESPHITADLIQITSSFEEELYGQLTEDIQWYPQFEFNALIGSHRANDWFMIIHEHVTAKNNEDNDNKTERKSMQPVKSYRQRALEAMMDGVLEIQLADNLRRGIKPPSFMHKKSAEDYTATEKEEIEEYEKKLAQLELQRADYAQVLNKKLIDVRKTITETRWNFDSSLYDTLIGKADAEININIQCCQLHLINAKRMKIHKIVKHLTIMGQVYDEIRSNFNLLKKVIDTERKYINELMKVRQKYQDEIEKKWEHLKQLIQYNRLGIFYYNKIKESFRDLYSAWKQKTFGMCSAAAPVDLLKGVPLKALYHGYDYYYRNKSKNRDELLPQIVNYFHQLAIINDPSYYSTLNKESYKLFIDFKVDKQKLELKEMSHKTIPLLRRRLKLKKFISSLQPLLTCCELELDLLNIHMDSLKRIEVTKEMALKYLTASADIRKGQMYKVASRKPQTEKTTSKAPEKDEKLPVAKEHSFKEINETSNTPSEVEKKKSNWINRLWEQYTDFTTQMSEDEVSIDEEQIEEEVEEEEVQEDETSGATGVQMLAPQETKDKKQQFICSQKLKRSFSRSETQRQTTRDHLQMDAVKYYSIRIVDKHLLNIAENMKKKCESDHQVREAVEIHTTDLTCFLQQELAKYKTIAKNNELSIQQNKKDNIFIRQRLHAEKNSLKCKLSKLQIENAILEKELQLPKIKSFPTFITKTSAKI